MNEDDGVSTSEASLIKTLTRRPQSMKSLFHTKLERDAKFGGNSRISQERNMTGAVSLFFKKKKVVTDSMLMVKCWKCWNVLRGTHVLSSRSKCLDETVFCCRQNKTTPSFNVTYLNFLRRLVLKNARVLLKQRIDYVVVTLFYSSSADDTSSFGLIASFCRLSSYIDSSLVLPTSSLS